MKQIGSGGGHGKPVSEKEGGMRDKDENKVARFLKSEDLVFRAACFEADIQPTKRQASKWLMKKGKAYKQRFGK